MKQGLFLGLASLGLALVSYWLATHASLDGQFVPAWFAIMAILSGAASVITGAGALGRFSIVASEVDTKIAQIEAARLKQLPGKTIQDQDQD